MEQAIIILYSFFQWVLTTSVMASIMVGLILLVKYILKDKLNIRWHYFLWILLIARLILPWTPESSISIYNLVDINRGVSEQITYSENTSYLAANRFIPNDTFENEAEMASSNDSVQQTISTDKVDPSDSTQETVGADKIHPLFSLIMLAWLIGVLSIPIYIVVIHRKFARKLNSGTLITDQSMNQILNQCKDSMHISNNVPLIDSNVINSPTLYGSIGPRLLLPSITFSMITKNELKYILYHELAHFKRKDIAVNWLMTFLLIIHWFNPILWYAYFRMREDQEMACDALALSFIDPNESTQYGHTIIKLTENHSRFASNPGVANFSSNKSQIKRRIKMIKLFKKGSYKWSVLGLAIVILISGCTLTSANNSDNNIVSITSFGPDEFTVLDKFIEDEHYYVKFSFESQKYFDKFKTKDNIRTYKLADKALYDKIDLKNPNAYPGFTIKSVVNILDISEEEAGKIKSDPDILMSKQEYSKFITIISIGGEEYETNNKEQVVLTQTNDKTITIYGKANTDEYMFEEITVQITQESKTYQWSNVMNPSYYPEVYLLDVNRDDEQEIVIVLTEGHGTGVRASTVHVLKQNFSEIIVNDPLHSIDTLVHTSAAIKDGKRIYGITVSGTEMNFEYEESDAGLWFEQVHFGNIIRYAVYNGKLTAEVPAQVSPGFFPGTIQIEYELNNDRLSAKKIEFLSETINREVNEEGASEIVNNQDSLSLLNIVLPENWKLDKSEQIGYNFIDDKGENRGSVSAINYIENFNLQTQMPNHSSVTNDEFIDIPIGTSRLITLDSDNGSAASGITGTHDTYYASIPIEDKQAIYILNFSLKDKNAETKTQFLEILKSLSLNNN